MLQNYNKYNLLKVFLDNPTESFRLRELSRLSKISPVSVINYLKRFEKGSLIKKFTKRGIPFYQAIRDNEKFKVYKIISIIYELNESGYIEDLWDKFSPEAIILYGSYAKGESIESSDIDLFVVAQNKNKFVEAFNEKLKKNIHLIFDNDTKKIPKELKNNLINGIVLKGYLKLF